MIKSFKPSTTNVFQIWSPLEAGSWQKIVEITDPYFYHLFKAKTRLKVFKTIISILKRVNIRNSFFEESKY